jgi:RecA-family ATPase
MTGRTASWADNLEHTPMMTYNQAAPDELAPNLGVPQLRSNGNTKAAGTKAKASRQLHMTPASTVTPRRVTWLWDDRVPAGEITLTPGAGGIGKSTFHAWLVARVTKGELPGIQYGYPRGAIICASEDSRERTIVPRLIAAGADLAKVYFVDVKVDDEDDRLILPVDVDALAKQIERFDVAVVSLDPVMSLISGQIDTHKDSDVRRALEPLSKLANHSGCAILGNSHFNKAMSSDPMQRMTGSAAFAQVVRSVLAFARDDDSDTCVMSQVKSNLGRLDLPSLAYRIDSVEIATSDGPTSVGRFVQTGESQRSVQDLLGESSSHAQLKRSEAESFLRQILKDGPMKVSEVQAAATEAGISKKTLRTARERVTDCNKEGMKNGWNWSLKTGESAHTTPKVPKGARFSGEAPSGPDGHLQRPPDA